MVNEIESNDVVDAYTYRLVLKHPYYPTLVELGFVRPFRRFRPTALSRADQGWRFGCVGTGPWVLTEHKDKQYALFTANKNYWGVKPRLQAMPLARHARPSDHHACPAKR